MKPKRPPRWKPILVVLAAGGLLAALLYLVGPGAVAGALASADRPVLVLVLAISVAWIVVWSRPLHLVLRLLGVPITARRSFLVFSSVMFVNNVVPFSVVGAQPVAALLVSRTTGQSYERSFAAVASVDVLNYLPAPFFAVGGMLLFAVTSSLGRTVEVVSVTLAGVFVLVFLAGAAAWRRRRRFAEAGPAIVARVGAYLPRFLRSDSRGVEQRVDAAIDALEQVAGHRPTLVAGVAASAVGWLLFASMLWLALYAVGATVPVVVPLFVVPLATVMDFVPTPGGAGSEDATLVLLVVLTTGVPAATATAAVIVHRVASVVLPVVVGGASIAVLRRP